MSFKNFKPAPLDMSCEPCPQTCQITTIDIPSSQGTLPPPSVDYNDGSSANTQDRSSEIREMLAGIGKHLSLIHI